MSASKKDEIKKHPTLTVIAGPNGAGKTTFAKEFLPAYAKKALFINADMIAGGLDPFSPRKAALEAGRLMLKKVRSLHEQKVDFAFETTLSGLSYLRLFHRLKLSGYRVNIFYLWLPNEEIAIKRVRARVRMGGHNVPVEDIRRRFKRGIVNLIKNYRFVVDKWLIIDNSRLKPNVVMGGKGAKIVVYDDLIFDRIRAGFQ